MVPAAGALLLGLVACTLYNPLDQTLGGAAIGAAIDAGVGADDAPAVAPAHDGVVVSGVAPSGDIADPRRAALLGMRRAGRHLAAIAAAVGPLFAAAGQRDLTIKYQQTRGEFMAVLRVEFARLHVARDDVGEPVGAQLCFELVLIQDLSTYA